MCMARLAAVFGNLLAAMNCSVGAVVVLVVVVITVGLVPSPPCQTNLIGPSGAGGSTTLSSMVSAMLSIISPSLEQPARRTRDASKAEPARNATHALTGADRVRAGIKGIMAA